MPLSPPTTDEVTMKEMGRNQQLQTGEVLIIVVVLFMWAGESGLLALHLTSGKRGTLTRPLLSQKRRVRGLEIAKRSEVSKSCLVQLSGPDPIPSLTQPSPKKIAYRELPCGAMGVFSLPLPQSAGVDISQPLCLLAMAQQALPPLWVPVLPGAVGLGGSGLGHALHLLVLLARL